MRDAQSCLSIKSETLHTDSHPQHQHPVTFVETVSTKSGTYNFTVRKWKRGSKKGQARSDSVVFLHGFLGHATDWDPIAAAVGLEADCFALNLPGYGGSTFQSAAQRAIGSPNSPSGCLSA